MHLIELCLRFLRLKLFITEYSVIFFTFDLWRTVHWDGTVTSASVRTGSVNFFCPWLFLRVEGQSSCSCLEHSCLCRDGTFFKNFFVTFTILEQLHEVTLALTWKQKLVQSSIVVAQSWILTYFSAWNRSCLEQQLLLYKLFSVLYDGLRTVLRLCLPEGQEVPKHTGKH